VYGGEAIDERGFANSSLAADEHDTALAGDAIFQRRIKLAQRMITFKEFHCLSRQHS
jgi:hypothetical protein